MTKQLILKKRASLGVIFVLLVQTFSAQAQLQGSTYAQAKASGSGTLTFTYMETPGFAAPSADGSITGLCKDLLDDFVDYVKETEGIRLTLKYGGKNPNDFNQFLAEVKSGRGGVIGLGNITITDARKQDYTFTPAFINNVSIIVTNNNVPTLNAMSSISEQFAGMKAYAVAGSTNEAGLRKVKQQYWPSLEIITYGSSQEVLETVMNDNKAFTNLDLTYYLAASKAGQPVKRHPAGDERSEEFGLLMPKGTDWAPLWDRFLTTQYRNSTAYREKISKHLGGVALKLLDSVR